MFQSKNINCFSLHAQLWLINSYHMVRFIQKLNKIQYPYRRQRRKVFNVAVRHSDSDVSVAADDAAENEDWDVRQVPTPIILHLLIRTLWNRNASWDYSLSKTAASNLAKNRPLASPWRHASPGFWIGEIILLLQSNQFRKSVGSPVSCNPISLQNPHILHPIICHMYLHQDGPITSVSRGRGGTSSRPCKRSNTALLTAMMNGTCLQCVLIRHNYSLHGRDLVGRDQMNNKDPTVTSMSVLIHASGTEVRHSQMVHAY